MTRTMTSSAARLGLITPVLLAPLLISAPAFAADNVICVGAPAGTCNQTAGTIQLAIAAADLNSVDDTILVGPGTYDDGPYVLDGTVHGVTLKGSGQGVTVLTMAASATNQDYVRADRATVRDLTIQMVGTQSLGDTGLHAQNSSAVDHLTVNGTGTFNAIGITATDSTVAGSDIEMPFGSGDEASYSDGGSILTDTTLVAPFGLVHSGTAADTLSRVTIKASIYGVLTDLGPVDVDDAVIDLGTSTGSAGLAVINENPDANPKSIQANHVTIVGGGSNSKGAYAWAAYATAIQQATITLDNSIVRGPQTDLLAVAGNNGGLGGPSTATITTSYSDLHSKTATSQPNGTAQVVVGAGELDADPAFSNPAAGDYRPTAASPVVDKGDAAAGGPALDRLGVARVTDGNGDGTAVRDMGAYELPAKLVHTDTTAPDTVFTSKPHKSVTKRRVTFKFVSTEAGSTFMCKLDRHAWRACTSPKRFRVTIGRHRVQVRATDAAANTDPTPARYRFRRTH